MIYPPPGYRPVVRSALLGDQPEALNLVWLSHDSSAGPHPDPNFTTLVRRTLQFVVASGQIDLVGAFPDNVRVSGLMRLLPAQAVLRLRTLPLLMDLPLYCAYGDLWVETITRRSHLYHGPYDPVHDFPVNDTSQALGVLTALR